MIAWLSNWLKNIIIIVLIASFVDVLLPNSNIQKYARMVLGLLIILTIITPILSIFSDVSASDLINKIQSQTLTNEEKTISTKIESNQQIANGNYQQKLITEVENRLLKEAKDSLENKFDIMIKKVDLDASNNDSGWIISKINVYVTPKENAKTEGKTQVASKEVKDIKNVDVVHIDISENKQAIEENKENKSITGIETPIKEILAKNWGIAKDSIHVYVENDLD